jgi:predicted nicotinamide N-methyase
MLEAYLQTRIPGSALTLTSPPLVPEIRLHLINDDYPRDGLNPDQVAALMDQPPYWCFCWASGQILARVILDNPHWVQGKTVVDFGAGSGVVGIAAKLAGAARVIVCDNDQLALDACRLNAKENNLCLDYSDDLATLCQPPGRIADLVTVADVFYDRDNLPLLTLLQQRFDRVLVADSRLKGQPLPEMAIVGRCKSHTVPDLDESMEFNQVTLYSNQEENTHS